MRRFALERRMDVVLSANDKGWLGRTAATSMCPEYLASGAHRHVYKGVYLKGPRKGEACVKKVFKTGSVCLSERAGGGGEHWATR